MQPSFNRECLVRPSHSRPVAISLANSLFLDAGDAGDTEYALCLHLNPLAPDLRARPIELGAIPGKYLLHAPPASFWPDDWFFSHARDDTSAEKEPNESQRTPAPRLTRRPIVLAQALPTRTASRIHDAPVHGVRLPVSTTLAIYARALRAIICAKDCDSCPIAHPTDRDWGFRTYSTPLARIPARSLSSLDVRARPIEWGAMPGKYVSHDSAGFILAARSAIDNWPTDRDTLYLHSPPTHSAHTPSNVVSQSRIRYP
ncbi:hypothetical protein FRC07_003225 [Ceratobasidium sp. 392]|nr:hypothetical protein FRC07_003225 [Ceratobasidium sp. 392]